MRPSYWLDNGRHDLCEKWEKLRNILIANENSCDKKIRELSSLARLNNKKFKDSQPLLEMGYEMQKILDRKNTIRQLEIKRIFFKKDDYDDIIGDIHDHLIEELDLKRVESECPIYNLPTGARWDQLKIEFENEFDVNIYFNSKLFFKANNEKMKFYVGEKNKAPSREWLFLYFLSIIEEKKETAATKTQLADAIGHKCGKSITINNCEHIAGSLSRKLQKIFGINDDAFFDYKKRGYYKTQFTLIPIPTIRGSGEVFINPRQNLDEKIDYKQVRKKMYRKTEY